METSTFLKIISITADIVTLFGVITAIRFAILKKHENILAFKISLYLQYVVRLAMITVVLTLLFHFTNLLYGLLLALFKRSWENWKEIQYLFAYFVSGAFGLSLAWIICSFIWTSSLNLAIDFINLFLPKRKILIKQEPSLEIVNATYGSDTNRIDITQTLRQMISDNKLTIKACNEIAGDPHYGIVKTLLINYRIGQKNMNSTIKEGETLSIPEIK